MHEDLSPAEAGFHMPAEWEEQDAIWLSWPLNPITWPERIHKVQAVFAEVAATISRYQSVRINATRPKHELIQKQLQDAKANFAQVELFDHPTDDVWCRDHGPIFVRNDATGEIAVTDWGFNGWGKFEPYDLDNTVPKRIAEHLGLRHFPIDMILEGGSIEVNGKGLLMTTEAVLFNENRNPGMSREVIEENLRKMLGVTEILWLGRGIEGDDTDGHIDDLARFINEDTVIFTIENDPSSPNYEPLQENKTRLENYRLRDGRRLNLIPMPMPEPCEESSWRLPLLPASYVNFLIINGAVLVPAFNQGERDQRAATLIGECFPGRQVHSINCLDIVFEGGALHCISQQQPKALQRIS